MSFRLNRELLNKDNLGKSLFNNIYPFPNYLNSEYPVSNQKLINSTIPIYLDKEDYELILDPFFNFDSFLHFLFDNFPFNYFSPDNHTTFSKEFEQFYIYLCKNYTKFYYLANCSLLDIDSPLK